MEKEDQARQNIGDPALDGSLRGRKGLIARAESGITPEEFEQQLLLKMTTLILELLLQVLLVENPVQLQPRQTMFSDLDYLLQL